MGEGIRFTKGHGTENDFVLVPDPDGDLDLDARLVARICDRRAGVGGDGLIRVVRTAALGEDVPDSGASEWFMDYRNADGTVAEMCGNGVRVLTAYLLRERLVEAGALAAGLPIGTRDGVKTVRDGGTAGAVDPDWIAVDMGPWRVPGGREAVAAGHDATVHVPGLEVARPALSVDLGNPHTVVALAEHAELAAVDLTRPPLVEPVPLDGTNVELVVPLDPEDVGGETVGRLRMRVHERGVGETRSCGTGACAAALAARAWAGATGPDRWLVDVPGGTLGVRVSGSRVELAGPAVLVADGVLDPGWVAAG